MEETYFNVNFSSQQQHQQVEHENSITVFLTVEKGCYEAGSYINGVVHLYIPPSAMGCTDYSGIHLRFGGQESLIGISQFHKRFLAIDTQLMKLPSTGLIPGQYDYPFYWKLPETLPCSMSCRNDESLLPCELSYNLVAYLHPVNTATNNKCGEELFRVVNCIKPIIITASSSLLTLSGKDSDKSGEAGTCAGIICEPQVRKVRSHLFNKGSIEIGLETRQTDLSSNNSIVNIGITGRNQSSINIKHLKVKWIETIEWGLNGKFDHCKTKHVLAERVVMLNNLSSWQAVSSKNKKQRPTGADEHNDKITLRLQLKNVRDSYRGRWMRVYHAIEVTAITEGRCATNPKVKSTIEVHRQTSNGTIPVMATKAEVIQEQQQQRGDDNREEATNLQNDEVRDGIEIPEAVPVSVEDPRILPYDDEEEEGKRQSLKTYKEHCRSFSLLPQVCAGGADYSNLDQHPCAVQLKILEPEMVMTVQQ